MTVGVMGVLLSPLWGISACVLALASVYGWYRGETVWYFFPSVVIFAVLCGAGAYVGRRHRRQLHVQEGAWLMLIGWLALSLAAALPYGLSGSVTWIDAWFEGAAAATTTGLVVAPDFYQHASIVFRIWRGCIGWLGGLYFLAFVVTVLPLLSPSLSMAVQGRQAVSFSPMVHPMVGRAANVLSLYTLFTAGTAMVYVSLGSTGIAALIQACLVISTTGGSAMPTVVSPPYEGATLVPLLLVSGNFLLYLRAIELRSWRVLWRDAEWRALLLLVLGCGAVVAWHVGAGELSADRSQGIVTAFFHVLSFASTSGWLSPDVLQWPELDRCILFILAFCGASLASLSGGLRLMRLIILGKMAKNELTRTLHPQMVVGFTVNGQAVPQLIISYVLAYFFVFMTVYFLAATIVSLAGFTPLQAMGLAIGCLSSVGATAGLFGIHDFVLLPAWLKVFATFLMIVGRLEIFALGILVKTALHVVRRPW